MKTESQLGIYMDHTSAIIVELKGYAVFQSRLSSGFTQEDRELALKKSENLMNNKKQHEKAHYYKLISETIRNSNEVLLFGPTDAKNELYNLLKKNHLFDKIKIEVKGSDKMEEIQVNEFVKEYFAEVRASSLRF